MILTKNEAAAALHTANAMPGFIDIDSGPRHIIFYEDGAVAVFDGRSGDSERFDSFQAFATRYGVAS